MNAELIDQYVDRAAIADDTSFLKKNLQEVLTLLKTINDTKISLGGTTTMKGLSAGSEDMKKQLESLLAENKKLKVAFDEVASKLEALTQKKKKSNADDKKSTDDAAKSREKLLFLYTDEAKVQAAAREDIRQKNAELKEEAAINSTVEGSINRAIAANKVLRKERNDLDLTTEEGRKRLKELNEEIDRNTEFITVNNDKLSQRKINIGNYVGAAKFIVDAMEAARKKVDTLNATVGAGHPAAVQARKDFEALRNITDNPKFLNISANFADTNQELRFFTKQLNVLEDAGMKNEKVYKDVEQRLAELTDQLGDTRANIKALASDTRSFDLFASSISFLVSTFQTLASATLAFGASEEDTAEITKDLVALENFANGVRGVSNELTTKGTAANKAYSFAQAQVAIAMDATATASARLRAGLITLGIGALIIGLGLVIANFSKLKDWIGRVSDEQKTLNEINKQAIATYTEEIVKVQGLVAEVNNENTSKRRKKEIIKELNDLSPVYFKNIKTEKDLQDKLNESVAKYIKAITIKAKVQAAEGLLVDKEKKVIERQVELETELEALKTKNFGSEAKRQQYILKFQEYINSGRDKELKALESEATPIRNIINGLREELDKLGGDPIPIIDFDALNRKDQQAALNMLKRRLQAEADYQRLISESELVSIDKRAQARQTAFDLEKKIILAQKAFDVTEKDLTEKQIADIVDDANKQIIAKSEETFNDLLALSASFRQKQKEFLEADDALGADLPANSTMEELVDREEKAFERRKANIEEDRDILIASYQRERDEKIKAAQGDEERQKIEKKFNDLRVKQELDANLLILQASLETAEAKLKIAKTADNKNEIAQLQKLIAELKRQLAELNGVKVDINIDAAKESLEKLKAGITDVGAKISEVLTGISDLIGANIDLEKNAIQDQMDAVEKKKAAEIEALNATTLSEEAKAAKLAIINAKAQSQKEALELKQRKLDQQRARFDKIKNITDAVTKGAVAVIDGLLKGGPALAAIYGTIAAIQIAAAIAAPIPRFKHGREGGPATFGITGDGGKQEVMYSPDLKHAFLTPAKDTLTYIPKGYGIAPSIEDFQQLMIKSAHGPVPVIHPLYSGGSDNSDMISAMAWEIQGLKRAIMSKQETHFHWKNGELYKAIQKGISRTDYINNI